MILTVQYIVEPRQKVQGTNNDKISTHSA